MEHWKVIKIDRDGVERLIGVFQSEEEARKIQEDLIGENAAWVYAGFADPIDVIVEC